ncbi:ABC transporter ATP-binding protein [Paenibacillus marinisediminis]
MDVIKISNVSKKFTLHKEKNVTLKEKLIYRNRSSVEEFWALDNVSCNIKKGTTVGLIGRNGSGKSTLLKLMTRIIYPTSGDIETNGRVSSLLELGAGFHPDFSGRENIYMNASILGFTKREIDERFNDIIEFSELEEFIDNPLRSYSSGMYMRLAFSVAISVDPDILLIDEVLSVGDSSFQKKCINKLKQLKMEKKTIVIVSHDNFTMETLCDEIIWLNKGKIVQFGEARTVVNEYMDFLAKEDGKRLTEKSSVQQPDQIELVVDEPTFEERTLGSRWGNQKVAISNVRMFNAQGEDSRLFPSGNKMSITFDFELNQDIGKDLVFGFGIMTMDGRDCYGSNTYNSDVIYFKDEPKGRVTINISELNLMGGNYLINIAAHQVNGTSYDYHYGCYEIQVISTDRGIGICQLKHSWDIQ